MNDDLTIALAAFEKVKFLERLYGDYIPAQAIEGEFDILGMKVRLVNRVQGIFKPKVMEAGVLSIKTTQPRDGTVNIYNDHILGDGSYRYSLKQGDPRGSDNKYLWQSLERQQPFIYFHAVAPAIYKAIWPCFVKEILPVEGYALISVGFGGMPDIEYKRPTDIESRYAVRESRVRLHQASFRTAVLDAYRNTCAVSGCSVTSLVEAAHIIRDSEAGSVQSVSNGIALSRVHHKAYDGNLMGIDPDCKIKIGSTLREHTDSKFILDSFIELDGAKLRLPKNDLNMPNRDYLAERYEQYLTENN